MAKFCKRSLAFSISIGLLSGCSTLGKSTATGAGIGAVTGGIAGSLLPGDSSSKPQNIIIGALAGGTVGALSGALIHKNMEEKERDAFEKGKQSGKPSAPGSTVVSSARGSSSGRYVPPRIERRWIEEEIRGNTLVEGHYEQVVVEEGRWE